MEMHRYREEVPYEIVVGEVADVRSRKSGQEQCLFNAETARSRRVVVISLIWLAYSREMTLRRSRLRRQGSICVSENGRGRVLWFNDDCNQ